MASDATAGRLDRPVSGVNKVNDIAKPIMRIEKACRRITEQIAHGTMTQTQLSITKHAVMDALTNILEARDWVENAIHSAEQNPSDRRNETRSVDEEGYSIDWSQKYQQLAPEIRTLLALLEELQTHAEKIAGLSPPSQKQTQPYVAEEQDSQLAVAGKWQEIRARAEAEARRSIVGIKPKSLFESRSLKTD